MEGTRSVSLQLMETALCVSVELSFPCVCVCNLRLNQVATVYLFTLMPLRSINSVLARTRTSQTLGWL